MKRTLILVLLLTTFSLSFVGVDAVAMIYKYVDENGSTVFVDDESKIPPKYRKKTETIEQEVDRMTREERLERKLEAYNERMNQEKETGEEQTALVVEHRTPVAIEGNMVIVPVKVRHGRNTAKLNLLLDTGASITVIHYQSLERFRFRRAELGLVQGVGGYVIPKVRVKFYKVEIGPYEEKYMPIDIIENNSPAPFDGLLGNDFLRKHKFEIDYENSVITWKS